MDMGKEALERALTVLGQVLEGRGLAYELVAIGGGSLLLHGLLERTTRDVDILSVVTEGTHVGAEPLPGNLVEAVRDVARLHDLDERWLNAGPASLHDFGLPAGFEGRLHTRRYGSLTLHIAGRLDQIHFKLYAAVDQGPGSKHMADLKKLEPTREELLAAVAWARGHDPSEGFEEMSRQLLDAFGVEE
jgi:hypothetical protein